MGVFSLWDLLLTTAQKISIQQLSGKVLAIDASIWLVKADSIFAEDAQKIKCILQKIIFLRKNNILPVFVFDGIPPAIKRKTLQKRRIKARQGSEIDVRKRTEIQVMRLLENQGQQASNKNQIKSKKIAQKESEMGQINKILSNLSEAQQKISQVVTDEDIMKIRLQSQVLTYKYQLWLEDPRLQGLERMDLQDFEQLQNEQKLQYLHLIENELYTKNSRKNNKQTIKQLSKLTPEQQIFYQMQKIEKKTKLRQLQDDLYRKTVQQSIKIEDGYEIIEEVRNGQKRVMKRKIPDNKQKGGWAAKGGKKQKNDFSAIFNYKSNNQQGKQMQNDDFDMYDNTSPDLFLADLIGKDLKKAKQQSNSSSKASPFQPHIPSKAWKLEKERKEQKIELERQANKSKQGDKKIIKTKKIQQGNKSKRDNKPQILSEKESSELDDFLQNSLIGQEIRRIQANKINQNHNQDIKSQNDAHATQVAYNQDNLPNFINYQNLLIRHLDSQDHRNIQFQKLLEMIGIPYIKATSEAEAQCASLQQDELVDGIVTEDSDIFLFGARNVFRGVFNDNIKYFSSHKILQKLKMNREKLIMFALLLGSDYTEGIKGIGIVNAMEILKIFDNFDKLQQFKKWARYADILHADEKHTTEGVLKGLSNEEQKEFYEFHRRFKNYWHIDDDFPKHSVIQAYLKPQVIDDTRIKQIKQTKFFQLKDFNEEAVKVFMKQRLLLTYSQTATYCNILKKPFVRQKQKKLTDFFLGQDHEFAKIRSKRLMKALGHEPQPQKKQSKSKSHLPQATIQ